MKLGYETLAEWEKDFAIYTANPKDTVFLNSIAARVDKTPGIVRVKIEEKIQGNFMVNDPWRFFQMYMKRQPKEYRLMTKSKEDPWFEC